MGTMWKVTVLLSVFALSWAQNASPVNQVISKEDVTRFKTLAEQTLSNLDPKNLDLSSAFYASYSIVLAEATPSQSVTKTVCDALKAKTSSLGDDFQSIYFFSGINKHLSCKIDGQQFAAKLKAVETASPVNLNDVFHAFFAASNLAVKLNNDAILKLVGGQVTDANADLSVLNQVYAVQLAANINKPATGAATHHDAVFSLIEDIVGQADEINEKYLQLEGGLGVTSFFIDGTFNLATKLNKAPQIIPAKLQMMTSYVLSRKDSQNVKNTCFVLIAGKSLSTNKYFVPLSVTLQSGRTLVPGSGEKVKVRVSTVMGTVVSSVTGVTADQVSRPSDGVVIVNKKALTASSVDKSLYELDVLGSKPDAGFYSISVSVASSSAPTGAKLVGIAPGQGKLDVKITSEIEVSDMQLVVVDSDSSSTTGAKSNSVVYPQALKTPLSADSSQKVVASFAIKDKASGKSFEPHQVFMRVVNLESQEEAFFVCEKSRTNAQKYEFELNIKANDQVLKSVSGDYELHLIVGDAVITNSFMWQVAKVAVHFYDAKPYQPPSFIEEFKPKPEIKHKFREIEARPPVVFSQAFALLTLLPLVVLILVWLRLGANVSNLSIADLPTLGFHGGLAAIFGLYYCYWTHLNMFQTLKCLAILGAITFFSGYKLLKRLAITRLKGGNIKKDD